MGNIIIVVGIPGAGKSTVLLEACKQVEKDLNYVIVSFGSEMFELCKETGLVRDRDEMRNLSPAIQEEMQWKACKRIAERPENILLDTHCTIKTGSGSYLPGFTPRMLEQLKPRAFVCVEAKAEEILGRRQLDKNRPLRTIESAESILEHITINRSYCAAYSASSASLLRFIQNNTGEFERGVKEFADTLRAIGLKK